MAATITPESIEAESAPASGPPSRATRVHVGELVSVLCALALAVDLFAASWYGVAGVPDPSAARPAISTAENGWDGLTIVRWIILATIAAALGSVILHASQRGHGTKTDTSRVVAALGCVTSVLLVYRVLIATPAPSMVIDQKLGAILGVLLALGIAGGGYESIREQRARDGSPVRSRRRQALASRRRRA
jgi:hypothetical protein